MPISKRSGFWGSRSKGLVFPSAWLTSSPTESSPDESSNLPGPASGIPMFVRRRIEDFTRAFVRRLTGGHRSASAQLLCRWACLLSSIEWLLRCLEGRSHRHASACLAATSRLTGCHGLGIKSTPGGSWSSRGCPEVSRFLAHRPSEKKRIADPTKGCNHHRRIVAVSCPELGEF